MPTVRRFRMKLSPTRGGRRSWGSMDRKTELPGGGPFTVSLARAGWTEPADTWTEGQGKPGSMTRTQMRHSSPRLEQKHSENDPRALPSRTPDPRAQRSATKSCSSVVPGGTGMGRLTWPIPLVFCSKSRTLEPEPEDNVAETLTGTSEAVGPDISRTTAWRDMGEKKATLRTVRPTRAPLCSRPSEKNLQHEVGSRHKVLLGVAEVQGEGR